MAWRSKPSAAAARRARGSADSAGRRHARRFSARTRCRPKPTATRTATSRGVCDRCCRRSPRRDWPMRSMRSAKASPSTRGQTARVFEAAKRAGAAGEAARRPALQPARRRARGALRRAVRRSSRIHRRGGRRRHGQGRNGGRAVARRVLFHPRDAEAAGRAVPQARRADRHRDRLQSRHVAAHLAAAHHEHGRHAVPPDRRRMHRRRHTRSGARAGPSPTRSARWKPASRCDLAIWDVERPAELRLSHRASIRCTRASGEAR